MGNGNLRVMSAPETNRQTARLDFESGDLYERCESCTRETPHDVRLEVASMARTATGADRAYANEPRRVTTCLECGSESKTWITRR